MYVGSSDHTYELSGRLVHVSTPTGGIGYGGYRTRPGGNCEQCQGGLAGLGCASCAGNCHKRAFNGMGMGQTEDEPGVLETAGAWSHRIGDLLVYGFAGLVLWNVLGKGKLEQRIGRSQERRRRIRRAKRQLSRARETPGFFGGQE